MNGAMLLQHAASVIEDRQRTYGSPERSFADTAARWSLLLGIDVSPAQVALCLIDLKLARVSQELWTAGPWGAAASQTVHQDQGMRPRANLRFLLAFSLFVTGVSTPYPDNRRCSGSKGGTR